MINAVFMQEPQRLRANRLLPNNLTIENIKAGNSNIRNPILASFAAKLLPYRGLGSSLLRALWAWPQIELIVDRAGNLFKVIVTRHRSKRHEWK